MEKSQCLNHFNWEHDYNLCYSSIMQHWNCFFSIWDWVCNHRQENVGTFISFHIYILCKNVVSWKPHIFRVGGLIIHAVHFLRKWNFSDFIHILHPIQLFIVKRSHKSEINRYVIWRAFVPWVMNKCYHSKWSLK